MCKHKCIIINQMRNIKQAHMVLSRTNLINKALLRAAAGRCGLDSANCCATIVKAIAKMERPGSLTFDEANEASLFCATTLHRFGLPVDFAKLEYSILIESCACCRAPLWGSSI